MSSDNYYRKFVTNIFQDYALFEFQDPIPWDAINIDFENQTNENQKKLNGNSWSIIKKYCISCGIWIDESGDNDTWSIGYFVERKDNGNFPYKNQPRLVNLNLKLPFKGLFQIRILN